jgi:hypothetical protein
LGISKIKGKNPVWEVIFKEKDVKHQNFSWHNKSNPKPILFLADIRDILIFAMEKRSRKKGAGGSLLLL